MNANFLTWPLIGKLAAIGVGMAVLAGSTTAVLYADHTNTAEPGVATYLCSHSTFDTLLQWRDRGSHLSGTWEQVYLSGQAPSQSVSSNSVGLSGTLNGTAITLSIGQYQPMYGTFSGGHITMNEPQPDGTIQATTCTQASIADWNKTVDTLTRQASSNNAAAQAAANAASAAQAQQQAVNQASTDDGQLDQDVSQLNDDYTSWSEAVATADSAYSKLKSMPLCSGDFTDENTYQYAENVYQDGVTVYQGESSLSRDALAVQGDISSLQSEESAADITIYNGDISTARAAVTKAQAAVKANDSNKIQSEALAAQTSMDNCAS